MCSQVKHLFNSYTASVKAASKRCIKLLFSDSHYRCCTLDEVASIAKFIVSPEASFNTAYTFDLTGGRAVY